MWSGCDWWWISDLYHCIDDDVERHLQRTRLMGNRSMNSNTCLRNSPNTNFGVFLRPTCGISSREVCEEQQIRTFNLLSCRLFAGASFDIYWNRICNRFSFYLPHILQFACTHVVWQRATAGNRRINWSCKRDAQILNLWRKSQTRDPFFRSGRRFCRKRISAQPAANGGM